jgi:hypothetical protein
MTSINEKMGLPRAGKRRMMNLPKNRADAVKVTAAICPSCQRTGARPSRTKGPGWLYCSWCNTVFALEGNS